MVSTLILGILSNLFKSPSTFLREWKTLPTTIRSLFISEHKQGLYESLEYEIALEILDPDGCYADYHKRHKVRFLQDNVNMYQDIMWGKGNWFSDYDCTPGKTINISHEEDRWNIQIFLRETKSKGDEEEFHIQTIARNVFTEPEEWQQVELRHHTRLLRLIVTFPPSRHCKSAIIHYRSRNQSSKLGADHFSVLPDGRQLVTWEATKIKPLEVITMRWTW